MCDELGQPEVIQRALQVRVCGAQLGTDALQVAQLVGDPAERPRRDEATAPAGSVSAAKILRLIGPHAFWPPQSRTAAGQRR